MIIMLKPGTPAPNFALPSTKDSEIGLNSYKGKPVVLVFYPKDNTPVCASQLALYSEIDERGLFDAQLLGISVDDVDSHKEFSASMKLSFPLLSDHPNGSVSKEYGVYDEINKTCLRATFVIDGNGVIVWSETFPMDKNPGADGIFDALDLIEGSG